MFTKPISSKSIMSSDAKNKNHSKETDDFFSQISNPVRRSILHQLYDNNRNGKKMGQISKELDIYIQALQRHINNLIRTGLIIKDANNVLKLTSCGTALIRNMETVKFLEENKEFFNTHSLDYLPEQFVNRIGDLKNAKKGNSFSTNAQEYLKMCAETKEFAKVISTEININMYKEIVRQFKDNKVKSIQHILGKNTIIPEGWYKLLSNKEIKNMEKEGAIQRKISAYVPILMYLSENAALIAFPDLQGVVDPTKIFYSYGNDARFQQWCTDLFDYLFVNSLPFREGVIPEVKSG